MDIDQLRAFCQLAEDSNYRVASEHLFITQSALTKKIQRLEEYMDAALFERGRHGAALTQVGKTLLPEARRMVTYFASFQSLSRSVAEGTQGYLNIGFGISTYHQAPQCIAAFKQCYPNVHITLNDTPSQYQIDALLSGDLQLSFNRLPVDLPLKGIPLCTDKLVIAVHQDELVDENDLWSSLSRLGYLRLNPERGPGLSQYIERFLYESEQTLKVEQEADDILTLLALVSARLGYTIVPSSTKAISPANIRFISLNGDYTVWDIGLIWNDRLSDPTREKFIQLVKDSSQ
ncbi:LysR family transcriptional regulator [Photobacterium minamisatsumaniensis]|uniref:LysR family transcriptional regulator n=1 Tax=Photobacterium minamisatsumaniensis TaxID=2910233 RepID=UPI003D0FC350